MSEHKNFPPSAYISFSEIKDGETFTFRYGDIIRKTNIFLIYCDNLKGIVPFGGESASVVIELGETSTIKITDNSQVCERTIFK